MKRAIFLDRDGIINEVVFRGENNIKPIAPWGIEEFKLIQNIKSPLIKLRKMEFHLFIVTNQPDISKGILKRSTVKKMNDIILNELPIDEIMVCPHIDSDDCKCRKPKPGMIKTLAQKWGINLNDSFLIGDNWKDIESGKLAGCSTILVDKFYNKSVQAEYRVKNLIMSTDVIKSQISKTVSNKDN
jgi:D-glycero-D-manno-heptose 1,7-bisphosphate phosphatase